MVRDYVETYYAPATVITVAGAQFDAARELADRRRAGSVVNQLPTARSADAPLLGSQRP